MTEITTADIPWGLSPVPTFSAHGDIVAAALLLMPEIDDPDVLALVEGLTLAVVESREQIAAQRQVLAAAMAVANQEGTERRVLDTRWILLKDMQRRSKAA